jgi:predicted DNA-binding transcriptional regulator YafY
MIIFSRSVSLKKFPSNLHVIPTLDPNSGSYTLSLDPNPNLDLKLIQSLIPNHQVFTFSGCAESEEQTERCTEPSQSACPG